MLISCTIIVAHFVGIGKDHTVFSLIDGLVKFEKFGPDRKKFLFHDVAPQCYRSAATRFWGVTSHQSGPIQQDPTSGNWNMDTVECFCCDNTRDLYPVTKPSTIPHAFLTSQYTWHERLGHPGSEVLRRLLSSISILCNKEKPHVLCHACQLGKHVRLPFVSFSTLVKYGFDIVYSDLWTSPIPSLSGFKYYVLFLDHYSQYVLVYPLVNKSDVLSKFVLFRNFVNTQLKCEIKSF
ncbi:ribonuclease H-like domain-containing protein [Tanacetum coccineum]|uniref:Ribonuclease H-like domain-containing protein n=1 Tax=Tanacetum coccineum TaxID=301880 RepID=A0ABQ5CU22_9ASTR